MTPHISLILIALGLFSITTASGCALGKSRILMITSTTIGVNIEASKSQQTPEVKIGYNREEFALLPTDRPEPVPNEADNADAVKTGNIHGANSTPDALMELNAQSNIALGLAYGGGVYQRLAVGKTAVSQPGAAIMMAKSSDGTIDAKTAQAIVSKYPPIVVTGPPPIPEFAARRQAAIEYVLQVARTNDKTTMDRLADALAVPKTGTINDERDAIRSKLFAASTNEELDPEVAAMSQVSSYKELH